MDTVRTAEHLAEGGVLSETQAMRIATRLADDLAGQLITKRDLEELRAELTATSKVKLTTGLSSVRNQLLAAQAASFLGIILYITFRLWP